MSQRLDQIQAGGGGVLGIPARAGLSALAVLWRCAWYVRRGIYAIGLRIPRGLPVPVVSVGNLAVGGTGKTPFAAWLVQGLLDRGHRPGILSRGYGPPAAGDVGLSDEGAVLRHLLGDGVPQVETPSRFRGGKRLLRDHPSTDVAVLDDGFQHWRLARDLDVVLLDATNPFGYGRLLPRGRLREPRSALARANLVVLTRTERRSEEEIAEILGEVARRTPAPTVCMRTVAERLEIDGRMEGVEALTGRKVFVACGIGNPAAFEAQLTDLGAVIVGRHPLPDHALLAPKIVETILAEAREAGAETTVMTRKDAVKLASRPDGVAVLDVGLEPTSGGQALWDVVEAALASAGPPN